MSMGTPIGSIDITTPIKNFISLTDMTIDQYLLGINNIVQGDGAKITLGDLIKNSVTQDEDNLIEIGSDGKLKLAASEIKTGQGWTSFPTLSVNWDNQTVTGANGAYLYNGVEVVGLSNFTSPAWDGDVQFLYYNLTDNSLAWYATIQDAANLVPLVYVYKFNYVSNEIGLPGDDGADGGTTPGTGDPSSEFEWTAYKEHIVLPLWNMGGISDTLINFLDSAFGTIISAGGEISGTTGSGSPIAGEAPFQPSISATTLSTASFSMSLPALKAGDFSYTQGVYDQKQKRLTLSIDHSEIVPTAGLQRIMQYAAATGFASVPVNNFVNVYCIATALLDEEDANLSPYWWITGSQAYETQAEAEAASILDEPFYAALKTNINRFAPMYKLTLMQKTEQYECTSYSKINLIGGGGSSGGGSSDNNAVISLCFGMSGYFPKYIKTNSFLEATGEYETAGMYPDLYDWVETNYNAGISGFKAYNDPTLGNLDWGINPTDKTFRCPLKNGKEGVFINIAEDTKVRIDNGAGADPFIPVVYNSAGVAITDHNSKPVTLNSGGWLSLGSTQQPYGSFVSAFLSLKADLSSLSGIPDDFALYWYCGNTITGKDEINIAELQNALSNKLGKEDKAEIISWGVADYSAKTNIAFPYTAPAAGEIRINVLSNTSSYNTGVFTIDGTIIGATEVAFYSGGGGGRQTSAINVKEGQVVSCLGGSGQIYQPDQAIFAPFYGAV